jgi:hypothetical protein
VRLFHITISIPGTRLWGFIYLIQLTSSQADKKCPLVSCPDNKPVVHYWIGGDECTCEADGYLAQAWNTELYDAMKGRHAIDHEPTRTKNAENDNEAAKLQDGHLRDLRNHKRQVNPNAPTPPLETNTDLPVFIPPPKQDITPELINQSLTVQPQNSAVVSSVIPHLADEVLTFLVQLDGVVASTLSMNASTIFPCGSIGADPQPNIMLVPKYVKDGTQQTIIANCRCIAVSMFVPKVLTYWIQKIDGTIYSLVGPSLISHIDKIDTGSPIALSLLPTLDNAITPRDIASTKIVAPTRRQVFKSVVCDRKCPEGMEPIPGNLTKVPPECGCLAKPGQSLKVKPRALKQPDAYTATMTEEVCKAMQCMNNGDKPAMHNPFSMTCWCPDPVIIEDNPSAWTGGSKA